MVYSQRLASQQVFHINLAQTYCLAPSRIIRRPNSGQHADRQAGPLANSHDLLNRLA